MKMVWRKEETSSCVGGTEEGVEDLASIMGVGRGETAVGILCVGLRLEKRVWIEVWRIKGFVLFMGREPLVGRTLRTWGRAASRKTEILRDP